MRWPTLAGILGLVLATGCAGRKAGPNYKSVEELEGCQAGECVDAEFELIRWADSAWYRGRMPYYCDPGSELDGPPDREVRRLIFVFHGRVGLTPEEFAELPFAPSLLQLRNVNLAMAEAQELDPNLNPDEFAIIAPNFQRTGEWQPWTDEDKRLWTWGGSTWSHASRSHHRENRVGVVKAESVSSFDVFDEFLRAAVVKFPALEEIVILGHSAGGQAVHRYALLGVGIHERLESEGIRIRYVATNPGSYAFPLTRRKLPPGRTTVKPGVGRGQTSDWNWAVPKGCEGWDDFGAGMSNLDDNERAVRAAEFAIDFYLRKVDRRLARRGSREVGTRDWDAAARQALLLQYATREVWHLQASGDHESTFPDECSATLQGRSRFERFSNFQDAWTRLVGIPAPNLHWVAVDGLKHQHRSKTIYTSPAGVQLIFF